MIPSRQRGDGDALTKGERREDAQERMRRKSRERGATTLLAKAAVRRTRTRYVGGKIILKSHKTSGMVDGRMTWKYRHEDYVTQRGHGVVGYVTVPGNTFFMHKNRHGFRPIGRQSGRSFRDLDRMAIAVQHGLGHKREEELT